MALCPKCETYISYDETNCSKCGYNEKTGSTDTVQEIKLIKCSDCEKEISVNADACPHCGAPTRIKLNKKSDNIKIYIILAIIILFIIFLTSDTAKMMFNSEYKECRKVFKESFCREIYIYK